jgi:hypothetical protein
MRALVTVKYPDEMSQAGAGYVTIVAAGAEQGSDGTAAAAA